jgi:hypothetical protein
MNYTLATQEKFQLSQRGGIAAAGSAIFPR